MHVKSVIDPKTGYAIDLEGGTLKKRHSIPVDEETNILRSNLYGEDVLHRAFRIRSERDYVLVCRPLQDYAGFRARAVLD